MAAKDYYKINGDSIERANQICPRCGEGVFLAEHKDRRSCGKCAYTEFKK
ncbi:MAG: 30S ribosomal protein S27ae [Methanolobus sp.]|nr:30S ribosomal protein S27ae [Methanolobus sp.]MDP2217897.1 30S ribosomal protein S27ae [Methanolobus sp.]